MRVVWSEALDCAICAQLSEGAPWLRLECRPNAPLQISRACLQRKNLASTRRKKKGPKITKYASLENKNPPPTSASCSADFLRCAAAVTRKPTTLPILLRSINHDAKHALDVSPKAYLRPQPSATTTKPPLGPTTWSYSLHAFQRSETCPDERSFRPPARLRLRAAPRCLAHTPTDRALGPFSASH